LSKPPHILITAAPEDEKLALILWSGLVEQEVKVDLWPIRDSSLEYCKDLELDDRVTHLVVLCSLTAANNFCVSSAISLFMRKCHVSNVLPILVSASQLPNDLNASYPAMLRQAWLGGRLTPQEPIKPTAIVRTGVKNMPPVINKILHSIGVEPRKKPWVIEPAFGKAAIAAALTVFLASTALIITKTGETQQALEKVARSENFANTMLSQLESDLSSTSRREVFSILGADVISSVQMENITALSDDQISRLSKLLHVIGDARITDGDVDGAFETFTLAKDMTGRMMARSPNNLERVFDHSQSVFWLANTAFTHGEFEKSKPYYEEYSRFSEALVLASPKEKKYQAELAYARSNSGIVSLYEGYAQKALEQFEQAIEIYKKGLLDAGIVNGDSLANAHAWSADAYIELGDLRGAERFRIEEQTIWRGLIAVTPKNRTRQMNLAHSLRQQALILCDLEELEAADQLLKTAANMLAQLSSSYPNNQRLERKHLAVMNDQARIALWQGNVPLAQLANTLAKNYRLSGEGAKADYSREFETGSYELLSARIAFAANQLDEAYTFSILAAASFERKVHRGELFRKNFVAEALFVQGEVLHAMGRVDEAVRAWTIGLQHFDIPLAYQSLRADDTQAKLLWRLGKAKEANLIREKLAASGYARKESIPVWNDLEEPSSNIASVQKEKSK
jgi:tetratricopeptide (TPR) repeat protein